MTTFCAPLKHLETVEQEQGIFDMPRSTTSHKKSVKQQVSDKHSYCSYCKQNRDRRGFHKHQVACRTIWQIRRQQQDPKSLQESSSEKHGDGQMQAPEAINSINCTPDEVSLLLDMLTVR